MHLGSEEKVHHRHLKDKEVGGDVHHEREKNNGHGNVGGGRQTIDKQAEIAALELEIAALKAKAIRKQSPLDDTFDCQQDLSDFRDAWSDPKMDWCCKNRQLGCKDGDAAQAASPVIVASIVAALPQSGDIPKATDFNCEEDKEQWKDGWSEDKKAWCCKSSGFCPEQAAAASANTGEQAPPVAPTEAPPQASAEQAGNPEHAAAAPEQPAKEGAMDLSFDCEEDLAEAKDGWSDSKKDWCCKNKGAGCPEGGPAQSPLGAMASTESKKEDATAKDTETKASTESKTEDATATNMETKATDMEAKLKDTEAKAKDTEAKDTEHKALDAEAAAKKRAEEEETTAKKKAQEVQMESKREAEAEAKEKIKQAKTESEDKRKSEETAEKAKTAAEASELLKKEEEAALKRQADEAKAEAQRQLKEKEAEEKKNIDIEEAANLKKAEGDSKKKLAEAESNLKESLAKAKDESKSKQAAAMEKDAADAKQKIEDEASKQAKEETEAQHKSEEELLEAKRRVEEELAAAKANLKNKAEAKREDAAKKTEAATKQGQEQEQQKQKQQEQQQQQQEAQGQTPSPPPKEVAAKAAETTAAAKETAGRAAAAMSAGDVKAAAVATTSAPKAHGHQQMAQATVPHAAATAKHPRVASDGASAVQEQTQKEGVLFGIDYRIVGFFAFSLLLLTFFGRFCCTVQRSDSDSLSVL